MHAAEALPTTAALWKDYDSDQGDSKEEIVDEERPDGLYHRGSCLSAYVLGEEIRAHCRYRVKGGAAGYSYGGTLMWNPTP